MTRLLIIMLLGAGCVEPVETDELAADTGDTSDTGETFRAISVSVCVDRQTQTCRLDQTAAGCLPTEDNACVDPPYSPRACTAPGAPCFPLAVGESCVAPFEDACKYF